MWAWCFPQGIQRSRTKGTVWTNMSISLVLDLYRIFTCMSNPPNDSVQAFFYSTTYNTLRYIKVSQYEAMLCAYRLIKIILENYSNKSERIYWALTWKDIAVGNIDVLIWGCSHYLLLLQDTKISAKKVASWICFTRMTKPVWRNYHVQEMFLKIHAFSKQKKFIF